MMAMMAKNYILGPLHILTNEIEVFQERPSFATFKRFFCTSFSLNGQNPLRWPERFCQRPLLSVM